MYGAVEFYKQARSRGIHPIIGCEVYVAPRTRFDKQKPLDSSYGHLVLLCENNEGYQNLIKMVSLSFTDGFYSKPRVDWELLRKYHGGLIALSACIAGEVPKALLEGDIEKAEELALRYRDTFGKDNYFLELQDHGLAEQKRINPLLLKLAERIGVGIVATNDVHYIEPEDYRMHKVMLCIQTGSKINEENPIEFKTNEFYLKTADEMEELFGNLPQALENKAVDAIVLFDPDGRLAEANPAADVEGMDAARKICILAGLAFGENVKPEEIHVEGITRVTTTDAAFADAGGMKIKLLGRALAQDGKKFVFVSPHMVPGDQVLAAVGGEPA